MLTAITALALSAAPAHAWTVEALGDATPATVTAAGPDVVAGACIDDSECVLAAIGDSTFVLTARGSAQAIDQLGTIGGDADGYPVKWLPKQDAFVVSVLESGGAEGAVQAVHASGWAAGWVADGVRVRLPVRWSPDGTMEDLPLPGDSLLGEATVVNADGLALGWVEDWHGHRTPTFWGAKAAHPLPTPEHMSAVATDAGGSTVVGWAQHQGTGEYHHVRWDISGRTPKFVDLGVPVPGAYGMDRIAVNTAGTAVGTAHVDGTTVPFLSVGRVGKFATHFVDAPQELTALTDIDDDGVLYGGMRMGPSKASTMVCLRPE